MNYQDRIRLFFKGKGIKLVDAAVKVGYSQSLFSQYLNSRDVNLEFINKLIGAYPEIDLNYVFKGESEASKAGLLISAEPETPYLSQKAEELLDNMEAIIKEMRAEVTRK